MKEITMKRHTNRRSLKVEVLEQREAPSSGLLGTEPTSFQWGIGRGVAETSMNGPVADVRLRRIVQDAATPPAVNAKATPAGGSIVAAQPTESLSLNW
jgi:hypothetical protein